MRVNLQPVSMGSPRSITVDAGSFRVTEAWFPPGTVLDPHSHDRSIIAVMLHGSFVTEIGRRSLDCLPSTLWSEPCEERHANHVGTAGAHVLVTQPDPALETPLPLRELMTDVGQDRNPVVVADARRIVAELSAPDSLSPFVVESTVTLMLARASRLMLSRARMRGIPKWLLRARDALHDCCRTPPPLDLLAQAAGVTRWHLAREFRRHFHASIGEYVRALRLNQALERIANGHQALSEVAFETGYADQSHLTRACKAATGFAPGAYRKRLTGQRLSA